EFDQQNRERQGVETQIFAAAKEKVDSEFDPARDAAIVVGARGGDAGVLGIVASRVARKYHRPTIVIGFDDNGMGKGSGRSIEGLNLVDALKRCSGLLEKFGGHEMAAGLALREENFDRFAEAFRSTARELLTEDALQPCLRLEDELAFTDIDIDFFSLDEIVHTLGKRN